MQQKVQVRGLTWLLLVHVAVSEDDDSGVLQERIKNDTVHILVTHVGRVVA